MTETTDRPLVTFALFAYNQEQYIREAVEGAFAQTYEPLEIILSDDCSTDRTFEIMQEMAAAYEGVHKVSITKNTRNLGLIGHVNKILLQVTSPILVLAAGDDISHQERTSIIVNAFNDNPRAMLAHSGVKNMDHSGVLLDTSPPFPDQDLEQIVKSGSVYIGATGAIRREITDFFGPIDTHETYEDLILGTRAALLGTIIAIPDALVSYRRNIGMTARARKIANRIERRRHSICRRIATLQQRELDICKSNHPRMQELKKIAKNELYKAEARLRYYDGQKSFIRHLFGPTCNHHLRALSSETKYVLRLID